MLKNAYFFITWLASSDIGASISQVSSLSSRNSMTLLEPADNPDSFSESYCCKQIFLVHYEKLKTFLSFSSREDCSFTRVHSPPFCVWSIVYIKLHTTMNVGLMAGLKNDGKKNLAKELKYFTILITLRHLVAYSHTSLSAKGILNLKKIPTQNWIL